METEKLEYKIIMDDGADTVVLARLADLELGAAAFMAAIAKHSGQPHARIGYNSDIAPWFDMAQQYGVALGRVRYLAYDCASRIGLVPPDMLAMSSGRPTTDERGMCRHPRAKLTKAGWRYLCRACGQLLKPREARMNPRALGTNPRAARQKLIRKSKRAAAVH